MLNLSDKELDRFSKEAAQEYEPGDVLGPRSWDKLEVRVNTEFGHSGWNPLHHFRRFPFYYAPALLVLFGITYYLVRPGVSSGSSPGTVKAPIVNVPIETPTVHGPTEKAPTVPLPTEKTPTLTQKTLSTDKSTSTSSSTGTMGANGSAGTAASAGTAGSTGVSRPTGVSAPTGVSGSTGVSGPAGARGSAAGDVRALSAGGASAVAATGAGVRAGSGGAGMGRTGSGRGRRGNHGLNGGKGPGQSGDNGDNTVAVAVPNGVGTNAAGGAPNRAASATTAGQARELALSHVQTPHTLKKRNAINDSALRAFTLKSTAPTLIKRKGGLHINRNLQFGLMIAPDFTSVNSLAGDKAGSSFGLTVDYQFANHWYIGTGILATRKNYAARNQDYHAPPGFYQSNGLGNANVSYVKGAFYMMEIPLNLRYDFSVSGNTLFFISGGASSYLMANENCNFYWEHYNIQRYLPVDHLPIRKGYLFSAVNLSAGVETGISNSLSLLIAPYVKFPTRQMGFGQVQMNSVGINFALKFAPVISRKRY